VLQKVEARQRPAAGFGQFGCAGAGDGEDVGHGLSQLGENTWPISRQQLAALLDKSDARVHLGTPR